MSQLFAYQLGSDLETEKNTVRNDKNSMIKVCRYVDCVFLILSINVEDNKKLS